jgi:hypothetical protein
MSFGIFSFDLAAIINSLSNLIEIGETESASASSKISLEKTEDVLQNVTATDSIIDDVLMAAALTSAVTPIVSATETAKTESSNEKTTTSKPAARVPSATLDEETRKEIERLIKSLQISVVHNYKSTDIIDESVALKTVANFPKRKPRDESDDKKEAARQPHKSEEQKLERLREELKKAILRNNAGV